MGFNGSSYDYFSDMCIYNMTEKPDSWTRKNFTNGIKFSHGGSIVYRNALLYYFGVNRNSNPAENNNGLYVLSLVTLDEWIILELCPNEDCGRESFSSSIIFTELLLIYGGSANGQLTNSFILLNLTALEIYSGNSSEASPNPRTMSTFSQVGNQLYLFGGRDNGIYYQDLWTFTFAEPNSFTWAEVLPQGMHPGPRSGHAVSAQGDYILYVGGESEENIFYSDYWVYDTVANSFLNIQPVGNILPPPLTEACVILNFPYFYLIGGRTYGKVSADMWVYDFSSNVFTLISQNKTEKIPLFNHGCVLSTENNTVLITTFLGSTSLDFTSACQINKYQIQNTTAIRISQFSNFVHTCRTSSAYTLFNDTLFIVGGQAFQEVAFSDVWSININDYSEADTEIALSSPIYSTAFASLGHKLLTFSGFSQSGYSRNSNPVNYLYEVNLPSPYVEYCGKSYGVVDGKCSLCPVGTYSGNADIGCLPCPIGTYNSEIGASDIIECQPCEVNTYTNTLGTSKCLNCNSGTTAFLGSTSCINQNLLNETIKSEQPDNYSPNSDSFIIMIMGIVFGSLIITFILIYFFCLRVRVL